MQRTNKDHGSRPPDSIVMVWPRSPRKGRAADRQDRLAAWYLLGPGTALLRCAYSPATIAAPVHRQGPAGRAKGKQGAQPSGAVSREVRQLILLDDKRSNWFKTSDCTRSRGVRLELTVSLLDTQCCSSGDALVDSTCRAEGHRQTWWGCTYDLACLPRYLPTYVGSSSSSSR